MDIRKVALAAVDRLIESEALEKMVAQAIEKTVQSAVTDCLSSYSAFGKVLKEKVGEALALHGDLDLPSYNHAILKIVATQLEAATNDIIQKQVADRLKDLLEPAPETITLSALTAKYVERIKEMHRGDCVCYGDDQRITVISHPSKSSYATTSRYHDVAFDEKPDKREMDCAIRLGITGNGEIYHLVFQNQDVEKRMFTGPFYGFERLLFQMKAAKTRLIIDCEADHLETSYAVHD